MVFSILQKKKTQKTVFSTTYNTSGQIVSVWFLEELKTPKGHFEIFQNQLTFTKDFFSISYLNLEKSFCSIKKYVYPNQFLLGFLSKMFSNELTPLK